MNDVSVKLRMCDMANEMRNIFSAPKDGKIVILVLENNREIEGRWAYHRNFLYGKFRWMTIYGGPIPTRILGWRPKEKHTEEAVLGMDCKLFDEFEEFLTDHELVILGDDMKRVMFFTLKFLEMKLKEV